jgi:hypothetical protein
MGAEMHAAMRAEAATALSGDFVGLRQANSPRDGGALLTQRVPSCAIRGPV